MSFKKALWFSVLVAVAGLAAAVWVVWQNPPEPIVVEKPVTRVVEVVRDVPIEVTHEVLITVIATREVIITATPEPTFTSTAIPKPTLTPRPTLTREPTSTPEPTATSQPTQTNVPTPSFEIPSSWKQYESMTGQFSLWYPSEWNLESEDVWLVAFDVPGFAFSMVGLVAEPMAREIGDEEGVNDWVRAAMPYVEGRDKRVTLVSKGTWQVPSPANYVEFEVTQTDYRGRKTVTNQRFVQGPLDSSRYVLVAISRIGTLGESEKEAQKIMLASVCVPTQDQASQGN